MLPPKVPLAMEIRNVRSFDGTSIAYRTTIPRSPDAPVVVLANGLGGPYLAWRALIDYLSDRYRFITWDYRGLYASGRPSPDLPAAYSVQHHVRDLAAVLAAEGVTRAACIGWSMGVQVALQAYDSLPGLTSHLVLLNGTYGRPLETVSPLPGMSTVIPPVMDLVARAHRLATEMTRRASGQPEAVAWLKRLGLVGRTLDDAVFAELVHSFGQLDMETFLRNLRALGDHDAEDVLDRISVPALVITGDRDLFTPRALAQKMARRIPQSEILVVRGGTHYAAVEYPELVGLRIERFLREHGL